MTSTTPSTPVLTPDEALDRLAGGLDDTAVGAFEGPPLLALTVSDDPAEAVTRSRVATLLRTAPVVLVGLAEGAGPPPGSGTELDILLCDHPDPPRPWVGCPDGAAARLEDLAAAAAASPEAATALVQLLRVTEPLAPTDAVVAESWVYSLLQAGARHLRWLQAREGAPRRPRPERPVVHVARHDDILLVTLDRPDVRNAFGTRMRDELVGGLQVASFDPSITRVELRGEGPVFCSGGDLDEFGTAADPPGAHVVRTTRHAGVHLAALADRVTAYVHGPCVGAGVELSAFAAEVVARSDTSFLLPEVAMGLVPGAGGTASVPRRIGRHRTAHLALLGRPLDVDTACRWRLVDRIDDRAFPTPNPTPADEGR